MRAPRANLTALAAAIVGVVIAGGSASAASAQPDYVGTWAHHRSACTVPQEKRGAPMIVTAGGYDQHETHCAFEKVRKVWRGWEVKAACKVEGDRQPHAFRFQATRDTLVVREGDRARTLLRC